MLPPSLTITLEEHVAFPALEKEDTFSSGIWKLFPEAKLAAQDTSTGRIASMNENHIAFQIMSHVPGLANGRPEACRKANDEMAEAVKKNPTRLGGLAALPMSHPDLAAAELKRVVKELGLLGAMIDNHLEDMTHYDDERFWPVFEMAERLDVPIYIHPSPPSASRIKDAFEGNYSAAVARGLSSAMWGWHEDTGLHVLKLYLAGLFERFPKLKIIIGHMGEMIPMMVDRITAAAAIFSEGKAAKFSDVWDRNIWVTSSGIFSVRVLEMLLKVTKKDRVMYSVDTPFSPNTKGWAYIQEIADKSSLSKEDQDDFAFGNAKKLFKLDFELEKF
ncbi:amidohydrolase 2 [Hypoxylon sp. FL1284]|nr:amidohydrolase 2 [Hypoxylon sp. FL1284]